MREIDPSDLWRDAEALYAAARRAAAWCRTCGGVGRLRDLLQAALPEDDESHRRIARALDVPHGALEELARGQVNPLQSPPATLAVLARGLRVDPTMFWALVRDDRPAADGPGIFRSALGERDATDPHAADAHAAERAFRDAFARELLDAPDDDGRD